MTSIEGPRAIQRVVRRVRCWASISEGRRLFRHRAVGPNPVEAARGKSRTQCLFDDFALTLTRSAARTFTARSTSSRGSVVASLAWNHLSIKMLMATPGGSPIYRASQRHETSYLPNGMRRERRGVLDCACGLYLNDPSAWRLDTPDGRKCRPVATTGHGTSMAHSLPFTTVRRRPDTYPEQANSSRGLPKSRRGDFGTLRPRVQIPPSRPS